MHIKFSSHFLRSAKKLPANVKDEFDTRLSVFRQNPFDPRLRTHKLGGRLKGLWSFSITSSHRIVFRIHDQVVEFLDIGDHRIYR